MSEDRVDQEESADTLPSLSKVEGIKARSTYLRGNIAAELAEPSSRFDDADGQLLKFHGVYQQEDRDKRKSRRAEGHEKAYMFMVRSKIPGGALTPDQYLVEDSLSDRYGNGTLRITTRQGIQHHSVLKGDLKPHIAAINEALLTTLAACGDVARNFMACPAPIHDRGHAAVQEVARQLADHLAPHTGAYHEIWVDGEKVEDSTQTVEPIYGPTYLPRKFKVGIAFPEDNCVDVYTQDIGLVPHLEGEHLEGFTVLVGGGMGMTHGKSDTFPRLADPVAFVTPEQVVPVVETIVGIQRDHGNRQDRKHARMKYLVHTWGVPHFRAELESRLGAALQDPRPICWHDVQDHLGWHEQGDGRLFVGVFIENGRIADTPHARVRTGLRTVIERFRPGVRLTPQQNILLIDIDPADRGTIQVLLDEHGIIPERALGGALRHSMACPAMPTCGLALAEAERALPAVVRQVQADLDALGFRDEPLSIRMTGCPNGCARPYMGDIGIVGRTKDRYNLYLGGDWQNTRLNTLYAEMVPVDQLAPTLRPLLHLWIAQRAPGEPFGDFCHRIGMETLKQQRSTERPREEVASGRE
jgi:sulfite reductase (ferredoxin)